jgi:hypothetical protein
MNDHEKNKIKYKLKLTQSPNLRNLRDIGSIVHRLQDKSLVSDHTF